jgi:hypothetical protein
VNEQLISLSTSKLIEAMAIKGLTGEALARAANVDAHTVSKALRGIGIRPRTATAIIIAIEALPDKAARLSAFLDHSAFADDAREVSAG